MLQGGNTWTSLRKKKESKNTPGPLLLGHCAKGSITESILVLMDLTQWHTKVGCEIQHQFHSRTHRSSF